MTDAREIIARHLCTMAAQGWSGISAFERAAYRTTAAGMVEAINTSGIRFAGPDDRILGPDEVDPVTLDRAELACFHQQSKIHDRKRTDWDRGNDSAVNGCIAAIRALGRKA